jgi:hypothetical protein
MTRPSGESARRSVVTKAAVTGEPDMAEAVPANRAFTTPDTKIRVSNNAAYRPMRPYFFAIIANPQVL